MKDMYILSKKRVFLIIFLAIILVIAGFVIFNRGLKFEPVSEEKILYKEIKLEEVNLGEKIQGEKAIIQIDEEKIGVGLGVKRAQKQEEGVVGVAAIEEEIMITPTFEGANESAIIIKEDNKILYKEIFPYVDVEYVIYDGHVKENIILKDKTAQREFVFDIKKSYPKISTIDFRIDSGGSYLTLVDNNTEEELLTLDYPIGFDAKGFPIPYHYRLIGNDKLILEAHDMGDWSRNIKFPVIIDPPMTVREYDEVAVMIGQDGADSKATKDGDIINIRPKGWRWGDMEYRDFIIVRIPKLTEKERLYYQKKLIIPEEDVVPGQDNYEPKYSTLEDAKSQTFWGINYRELVKLPEVGLLRFGVDGLENEFNKNDFADTILNYKKDNPILDLTQLDLAEIFTQKEWATDLAKVDHIKKWKDKHEWLKNNKIVLVDESVIEKGARLAFRPREEVEKKTWLAKWWDEVIPPAWALTTNTYTVGTGSCDSSCDYSTLSAWETARASDLPSNDFIEVAECYNDGAMSDDVDVDGAAWETDATRYVKIYTPTAERHNGTASTGFKISSTDAYDVINYTVNYIIIDGLVIDSAFGSGTNSLFGIDSDGNTETTGTTAEFQISNNIAFMTYAGGDNTYGYAYKTLDDYVGTDSNFVLKMWNNIAYGYSGTHASIKGGLYIENVGNSFIYNNTFTVAETAGRIFLGYASTGVHVYKNNVAFDGVCYFASNHDAVNSTNNMADDTSAIGVNPINSSEPTFVNKGGNDYHLDETDTTAQGAGADLDQDSDIAMVYDIDGDPRDTSTPDVGADEYYVAPAGSSGPSYKIDSGTIKIHSGGFKINKIEAPTFVARDPREFWLDNIKEEV